MRGSWNGCVGNSLHKPRDIPGARLTRLLMSAGVHEDTDAEIVHRVLDDERAAFRDLVTRYQARVFRIALGYTRDRAESEDITQEVFLRAYHSLCSYDTDRPFAGWLFTIAANVALSRLRKARRSGEVLGAYRETVSRDSGGRAERDAINRDLLFRVGEMLSKLPPRQREAFLLRYYLEMRHEEVAQLQGRSTEAVRQDVVRARRKLLDLLVEKGVEP